MANFIGKVIWAVTAGVWTCDYVSNHRPYQAGIAVFSGLLCLTLWTEK